MEQKPYLSHEPFTSLQYICLTSSFFLPTSLPLLQIPPIRLLAPVRSTANASIDDLGKAQSKAEEKKASG